METANGTSSYTLERGFGAVDLYAAIDYYNELAVSGRKKKRFTMIDNKKRTILSHD